MPVDDHDEKSVPPSADEASRGSGATQRSTPPVMRRGYLSRRNALIAAIGVAGAIAALIVVAFLVYRFGFVDRYLVGQIKSDFAKYGVRADIKTFHASVPPGTVHIDGVELFDSNSGEKLGKIDRMTAIIRIEDLYSFNLSRHVDLRDLKMEGLELWVNFDNEGRSNFRNLHLPPPEPNKRILFAYST